MRFVTFETGGSARAGVLDGDARGVGDGVYDLAHPSMTGALHGVTPDVLSFIREGLPAVADRIALHGLHEAARLRLTAVKLLAPIPAPPHIHGAAHNFWCAIRERGIEAPAAPVLFDKAPHTVIGPGALVHLPPDIGGVTYEAELAAVIGTGGSGIPAAVALDHVCGYTIFNDVSASDMIRADGHFRTGKNLATFGPLGPFLATTDEIPDPQALRVTFEMNGETLQDGTTASMLFPVAELIAVISRNRPLVPGDVIATGTPAGVAAMRKPPAWLRAGTEMTAAVEGLGALTNPIVEGPPFHG